jgi:hypothetical protein
VFLLLHVYHVHSCSAFSVFSEYYVISHLSILQAVLQKLNNERQVTKGARISKVDIEDTKVAESVLYSVNLQMDIGEMHGTNYELQVSTPHTR